MPRPPRADEPRGLYHALRRTNLRGTIFKKEADDVPGRFNLINPFNPEQGEIFPHNRFGILHFRDTYQQISLDTIVSSGN